MDRLLTGDTREALPHSASVQPTEDRESYCDQVSVWSVLAISEEDGLVRSLFSVVLMSIWSDAVALKVSLVLPISNKHDHLIDYMAL